MRNRIFYKIVAIIISIIAIYSLFIIFVITPKVTNYISEFEVKQAKLQLKRVTSIIELKETFFKSLNNLDLKSQKKKFLEELTPLIRSITLEGLGYIFIINKEPKIVLHPEILEQEINTSTINTIPVLKPMFEKLKKAYKDGLPYEYTWHKKDDLHNFVYEKIAWSEYNDYFGWYIVSTLYKDDIEKSSQDVKYMIITLSIILFVVLFLLTWFLIKKLLNPIVELSKSAHLVEEGRFDIRCSVNSDDELGILSRQFNKMLDFVEDNTKSLEKKILRRAEEIEHKFYHESVTKLKNRYSLLKELKNYEFSALNLVSIDDFDDINELYGYEVGDEVLRELAKRVEEFANSQMLHLYKVGASTFALLDTNIRNFLSYDLVLQKILQEFQKPVKIGSLKIEVIFDITIGTSISQENQLVCANVALKNAKKKGLKFTIYNQTIDTQENIKNTIFWREKINSALKEDKVVPFFQPIFNKKGKLIKYEVLMRIEDIVDGNYSHISPTEFLDIAFKIRQYYSLNRCIIKKAFKYLPKIDVDISINLSFSDIMNSDYMKFLEKEIASLAKKDREKLVFEILESDAITDSEVLDEFISEYRSRGIRVAIDDFGTGFSNFSYILKIKPDYIKIDGSLIKNIDCDENSYEIVKSITTFSKSLDIVVVAEFIHSKEVYEIAKNLGVDEFQGYYLGEPKALT